MTPEQALTFYRAQYEKADDEATRLAIKVAALEARCLRFEEALRKIENNDMRYDLTACAQIAREAMETPAELPQAPMPCPGFDSGACVPGKYCGVRMGYAYPCPGQLSSAETGFYLCGCAKQYIQEYPPIVRSTCKEHRAVFRTLTPLETPAESGPDGTYGLPHMDSCQLKYGGDKCTCGLL